MEDYDLDIKKLKPEDGRFLLYKNFQKYLFNKQTKSNKVVLIISVFALLISGSVLILTSNYVTINQKLFSIIFLILFSIFLIYLFVKFIININKQQENIKSEYDNLFKEHFNYSIKKAKDGKLIKRSFNKKAKHLNMAEHTII